MLGGLKRKDVSVVYSPTETRVDIPLSSPTRIRGRSRRVGHLVWVLLVVLMVGIVLLLSDRGSVRPASERRVGDVWSSFDKASNDVLALQRASYMFLQASAYQHYVVNTFANPNLNWPSFVDLFTNFARLMQVLNIDNCTDGFMVLENHVSREKAFPPRIYFENTWQDELLNACSCGFNPTSINVDAVPSDVTDIVEKRWVMQTLRLVGPHVRRNELSYTVPFLSWRIGKTASTDSRLIEHNSMYKLVADLWIAVHNFTFNYVEDHEMEPEKMKSIVSSIRAFFTSAVRVHQCQVCMAQFITLIPDTDTEYFDMEPDEVVRTLLGVSPSQLQRYPNQEPKCSVGWQNRPEYPVSEVIATLPDSDMIIPPVAFPTRTITVVLDMDETFMITRHPPVTPRPYLQQLMQLLQDAHTEIILWTAATKDFSEGIRTQFPSHGLTFINQSIYRDPKWFTEPRYTKDLRRLGRNMHDVVIIENSPSSVWMNKRNAILVPDFFTKNEHDAALLRLMEVLRSLFQSNIPVQQFITSTPLLHSKCPRYSYSTNDDAGLYYGIGDFTN